MSTELVPSCKHIVRALYQQRYILPMPPPPTPHHKSTKAEMYYSLCGMLSKKKNNLWYI